MPNYVFHVGYGKTGTSAIQSVLRNNAGQLRANGVACCDLWLSKETVGEAGFGSHAEFSRALAKGGSDLTDRLSLLFNPRNPTFSEATTIVWSNEALATLSERMGMFITQLAAQADVKVVIYLRNQVDWLVSAYLQWGVKDKQTPGPVRNWAQFLNDTKNSTSYLATLQSWKASIGNATLNARSYDDVPDIVQDFQSITGIVVPHLQRESRVYKTPAYTANALFKIINDQYSEPKSPEPLLSLLSDSGVLERDLHCVDPCVLDVPYKTFDQLANQFADENSRLESEFGVVLKRSGLSGSIGRRKASSETNTDLIAALMMVSLQLDKRVRTLADIVKDQAAQLESLRKLRS